MATRIKLAAIVGQVVCILRCRGLPHRQAQPRLRLLHQHQRLRQSRHRRGSSSVASSFSSDKTVMVTFQNNTARLANCLRALSINWPQATNGNLTKITLDGTTIYSTSTGGGSLTIRPPPLGGTTAQRTIAAGACGTVVFSFQNNANTNLANYTGSLTFSPFGSRYRYYKEHRTLQQRRAGESRPFCFLQECSL